MTCYLLANLKNSYSSQFCSAYLHACKTVDSVVDGAEAEGDSNGCASERPRCRCGNTRYFGMLIALISPSPNIWMRSAPLMTKIIETSTRCFQRFLVSATVQGTVIRNRGRNRSLQLGIFEDCAGADPLSPTVKNANNKSTRVHTHVSFNDSQHFPAASAKHSSSPWNS